MSKSDMIEAIRKLNPSARTDFLASFSVNELDDYLRKLQSVRGGHDRRHSAPAARAAASA